MESVGRMLVCARCSDRTALCSGCDHARFIAASHAVAWHALELSRLLAKQYQCNGIARINHVERTRTCRLQQHEQRVPGAQVADFVTH